MPDAPDMLCAICGKPVGLVVDVAGEVKPQLHVKCFYLWDEERRELPAAP